MILMSVLLLLVLEAGEAVPELSVAADELGTAAACDSVSPAAEDVGSGVKDAMEDDCGVIDEVCDEEYEEGVVEGIDAGIGLLLKLGMLEDGLVDAANEVGELVDIGTIVGNSTNVWVWVAVTVGGGVVAVELARVELGVTDHIQLTTAPSIVAVTHCVCASATLLYASKKSPAAFFMVGTAAENLGIKFKTSPCEHWPLVDVSARPAMILARFCCFRCR